MTTTVAYSRRHFEVSLYHVAPLGILLCSYTNNGDFQLATVTTA